MRVLIAGSSGLLGSALVATLRDSGHDVRRLVRRPARAADEHSWDPPAGRIDDRAFEDVTTVVNLCGSPMGLRWSAARKQMIRDSRIEPTEVLAEAVAEYRIPALVNASGIGYYGDTGDAVVTEESPRGAGFLAELCEAWEAATAPAAEAGSRVVNLRTGLVLSKDGLLGPLKPLFWLGLGGRLGDGRQYMPWISLRDHVSAMRFLIEHETLSGPVNVCNPEPATNAEFTRALGHALRRPAPWWVPGFALRTALGEVADEMALISQRAVPAVLEKAGFTFVHTDLDGALAVAL
ncbi:MULTISPECIES: TIGR01777 family oxidoreductase [Amycolatopsis]|uniref:TIGR01777 family oxidoreductase n=1 Tax=Amycolatopsis tucumanensis TaxID=401106 RepID=A0ABP7I9G1_9PSEU|nr:MULTISPECIES: TIGR01777 family oxidoreductase [Amycolatopsis]MCF6425865.1 TIGR01777 family oxidoreductase [Amycolatopsis tucumanensis]